MISYKFVNIFVQTNKQTNFSEMKKICAWTRIENQKVVCELFFVRLQTCENWNKGFKLSPSPCPTTWHRKSSRLWSNMPTQNLKDLFSLFSFYIWTIRPAKIICRNQNQNWSTLLSWEIRPGRKWSKPIDFRESFQLFWLNKSDFSKQKKWSLISVSAVVYFVPNWVTAMYGLKCNCFLAFHKHSNCDIRISNIFWKTQ